MTFTALVVEKAEDGTTRAGIQTLDDSRLPAGDVTVAVCESRRQNDHRNGLMI